MKQIVAKTLMASMLLLTITFSEAQQDETVRLIVRADDIGSSHAANEGCMDSYTKGIARSVEVMVNCSWFPEAAKMLAKNPGYDVGVHLMLTSEWDQVKWRPLTHAPSLVDENGYFYPMIWPNDDYPEDRTLRGADWKIDEIENELRAQIEMAMKHIPQVSHVTTHMGFSSMDESVDKLVNKLAGEYDLDIDMENVKRMPGWEKDQNTKEKINTFIQNLSELKPGTYMFVEHPALDHPEMKAISLLPGKSSPAKPRDDVTKIFTSPKVMKYIKKNDIELISYADLLEQ